MSSESANKSSAVAVAVPLLFIASGATALVYEVIWSKCLALMFGSTVQAQTVVLAVFMGGLAAGNRIFGNRAARAHQPLALYGYLEAIIGIYAFFFDSLHRFADGIFQKLGTPLLEHSSALLMLKGAISVGLLALPTILMGGTLPLLAGWLQRQEGDASRRSARFYSLNSLGAVLGSFLAGFLLVRYLGMESSLQLTAMANVLVGLLAVGISRKITDAGADSVVAPTAAAKAVSGSSIVTGRETILLVTLTGAISMGLEVLASRCLGLVFGSSLPAFALVLMAFILGIGLGSAVVASPRWKGLSTEVWVPRLLVGAALWITGLVLAVVPLVYSYVILGSGLARNDVGYWLHQIMVGGGALFALGLPAGLMGAVLPLCIRSAGAGADDLPALIGRLLTWNTVGCVTGVLLTGFVLMPLLGLRAALLFLALILCSITCVASLKWKRRGGVKLAIAGAVLVVFALFGTGEGWKTVLSSGIFRRREWQPEYFTARQKAIRLVFYEDAPDATVSVEQTDGVIFKSQISLRINGKVDASNVGDLNTQYLLGHLPLIARPASKDVFVLGFGSGITAGAVLGHPVEKLVIAENCAPVLRAAKFFEPWNRNVLHEPRTRVYSEDARTVLKLSPQTYDVIISEPSNPWMVGVGSVFSQEFYQLAASRLKDGGIMTQWFHAYEMSDQIVDMVFKTFSSVFPYMEIWDPGTGDLILLGSQKPWPNTLEHYGQVFGRKEVASDLAAIGITSPALLWTRQLASQRTAPAAPQYQAIQSDAFPVLEYDAPRAFFRGQSATFLSVVDERTRQGVFASLEKQLAFASLKPSEFRAFLSRDGSVNPELADSIRDGSVLLMPSRLILPPNLGEKSPVEHRRIMAALQELRQQTPLKPGFWKQLQEDFSHADTLVAAGEGWVPSSAVMEAVRYCLERRDTANAAALLTLRGKFPHPELDYLQRLTELWAAK
ncbi:MAG TPA: fused MFS/spermidine synthase [Roseimicrobium sp.]|nr:fused MFS/spermidine synthase [Roseimicrobium sp.]